MTEPSNDWPKALMAAQAHMMSATLSQTCEYLDFLKRRVELDRQLLAELAQTADAEAAARALSAFYQRACSDYLAEAGRLGAMMTASVEQFTEGAQEEAEVLARGPS